MTDILGRIYKGKNVLITGHTGFKGSWLALWLCQIGAKVIGYALPPETSPNHFELLGADFLSIIGDIRDADKLQNVIKQERPEIIFHLAAQSIVRKSYQKPVETFDTNIMGLVNLMEACRQSSSVRAVVVITSDKCYENREWVWGYRENDAMGGYDPYSASKGCTEIVTSSYRRSFFSLDQYGKSHSVLVASARAGNAIGGGDWAQDRLIPDIVKAAYKNEKVIIRNPNSSRPWQHVLESLSGYLALGQKLLEGRTEFAEGWNFGPGETGNLNVETIIQKLQQYWRRVEYQLAPRHNLHEACSLQLDCSKARLKLAWTPLWDVDKMLEMTGNWYNRFYESQEVISAKQLIEYVQTAKQKDMEWAKP